MNKVSIIIPVYNKEKYVIEALESAVNQTYKNIEIIVLNDASTDNSRDVILKYIKTLPDIIYIEEPENSGICLAKNKAIAKSSGEYIFPLDADDIIDKTYIEKAVKILDENPDIGVVYCNFTHFQDDCSMCECKVNESDFIYHNQIVNGSMIRKSAFYKAGQYKEWLNRIGAEDWELWISCYESGTKFKGIDEYLYHYRIDNNSHGMTDIYTKNMDKIKQLILLHHLPLYIKNNDILTKAFDKTWTKTVYRAKKYKKLFNVFLPVIVTQFILLISSFIAILYLICDKSRLWGGVNAGLFSPVVQVLKFTACC